MIAARARHPVKGKLAPWLPLLLLFLLPPGVMAYSGFKIEAVETHAIGDELVMDLHFSPQLSPVALEALDNGVPLTLEVYLQVRSSTAWIWDSSLVDRRLRYGIRYQPLAGQYLVGPVSGTGHSYVTRDAAIAALGDLRNIPLLKRSELKDGIKYEIDLKVSLDIEDLPLPLRPMAYLLPSWKHSTGWTTWPLQP